MGGDLLSVMVRGGDLFPFMGMGAVLLPIMVRDRTCCLLW